MLNTISSFVAGLLPMTDKADVLQRFADVIEEIEEITIPSFKAYNSVFKNTKYKSVTGKNIEELLRNNLRSRDPLGVIVEKSLEEGVKNLKVLRQYVQNDRAHSFAKDAMRYKTASIMRFLEAAAYASRYANKLTNYLVTVETLEANGEANNVTRELPPNDVEFIKGGLPNFAVVLKILTNDHTEVQKTLEETPDIIVTGDPEQDKLTEGASDYKAVDPLRVNFISLDWNPFWHIGRMWINYRARVYHAMIAERETMETRLLIYKNQQSSGARDARTEARAREAQARLDNLNKEIAKMEKSWKK